MSIRLNKAIRELNIGLQTAVDFLEKKSLGEVKGDPNFKLSDEQYTALVEQFKSDKDVKTDAAKIFQKKTKEKKQRKQPLNSLPSQRWRQHAHSSSRWGRLTSTN